MKKLSFKLISAVLSVVLVVTSLPMAAIAIGINEGESVIVNSADTFSEELNHDIVEIVDMRTSTDKYFRLDDGTYYIAHYNSDVHYLDDNGVWQNIDNSLSITGSEITTSDAKIKFAKKTTGNGELFTLHDGNHKLSLSLRNANKKIEGVITNFEAEFDENTTQLQKMTTLDKISASVRYNNILENIDLEYVIKGSSVKENIIVKSKSDNYTYAFDLSLNNLVAALNDKGEILISDAHSAEVKYFIPAPFMWDANDAYSDDTFMALSDSGNGKYVLTITADADWLNDPNRVFPVTIDPPIYTSADSSVLDLDFTTASSPSEASTSLYVSSAWRTYWKLKTLPSLPMSAYITNATFTMDCYTSEELNGYVAVYDVLTDWDETLTYSKTIATSSPAGKPAEHFSDFEEIYTSYFYGDDSYYLNSLEGYSWNITPIVKKWYSGENYGMMFAPATDTVFTGIAKFRSNNYYATVERPQLCIEYRDMKGVEDYWTFSSQSAGFAGSGSVNNATGNLVFSIPTLTSTDALMPITPAMIYNSSLAGKDYSYANVQTSNVISSAPKGFKLNLHETLLKKSYTGNDGSPAYYFVWADSDGTEHYFMPTSSANTYTDEDGLLLTLEEGTTCTITDSNKNVRTFSSRPSISGTVSGWYLSSISDKNGNKVTISIDSSYRPIAVNLVPKGLSAITQLKIAYNSHGDPYVVWNPNSGEGVVFRTSSTVSGATVTSGGNYLRQTIRAHGGTTESQWLAFYNTNSNSSTSTITVDAVAEYTYNSSGLLTSAVNNLSKYKISYSYDSAKRVSAVSEYATATGALGQKITLTYGTSSTVIRTSGSDDIFNNSDDLITTYAFDYDGRTISCYTTDLNKTQIYGASNGQYVGSENTKAVNSLKSSVQTAQQSSNYLLNGSFEDSTSSLTYWSKTGTAACSYEPAYVDHSRAALSVDSSTTSSSIYQYVFLRKGHYTLSIDINTHQSQNVSVYLRARSLNNLDYSVEEEIPVNEYYATGSTAFASLNFSASPSTAGAYEMFEVAIIVIGAPSSSETVYIDNVMLSKTIGTAEYDAVRMGNFEYTYASYYPKDYWKISGNESTPITTVDIGSEFGYVLHVDAGLDEIQFVEQIVHQTPADLIEQYDLGYYRPSLDPITYTVSGWGKGTGQSYAETSLFGIRVKVKYHDGSTYGTTETFNFRFDKGITDWQFISGGFTTNPEKGLLESITVMLMYNDHSGDGYFDNISLVQDNSASNFYEYNALGYLSSHQSGRHTTWYKYNGDNNVIVAISSNKTIVEYEYDSSNRVIKETHSRYTGYFNPSTGSVSGTITVLYYTQYTYNPYGQPITVRTTDYSDTTKQIHSYTAYNVTSGSHIFGTVSTETDALGNITRYFYNTNNGRLLASIYPEGNGVSYQYDAVGNLTMVTPAEISATNGYVSDLSGTAVTYAYDSTTNRLNTITTKPTSSTSTTYTFAYDVFGNTSAISVGNRNLASYTYNSNNGKLNTLTYGNGHKVKYVYDILDRIAEVQYNIGVGGAFETVYSYTYDSAGNVYSVTDHVNGEVTLYKYDALGKLVDSNVYDSETYLNLNGTTIYYNDESKISMVFYSFDYDHTSGTMYDSTSYSYTYNVTNGNIERLRVSGGYISGTIDPVYDNFGRTSTRTLDFNINDADAFYNKLTYDYKTNGNNESALVSEMHSEVRKGASSSVISSTTYKYVYDANGNITQITNSAGLILNKYYYDDLNQLIREDNRSTGYSYVYEYDNAGNITAKKTYVFTTGTLGSVLSTVNYTYGDSSWKDLLTKYGSTTITYDSIGNPLTIGSNSLTWQGRQLKSWYDGSSTTINYGYNADGIRTYKEVYDASTATTTRHEYLLSGSQIVKETVYVNGTESYTLVYLYDETGSPIGYRYRTPSYASGVFDGYFYEKNLQGDIIKVFNQSGTQLANYIYDAWGNPTITYLGNGASTPAKYNPFAYRGYYLDSETGFYLTGTRYYDPEIGRFINADNQISGVGSDIRGYNLFAYCFNTPVNMSDPTGNWPRWITVTVFIAAVVVGVAALTTGNVALATAATKVAAAATVTYAAQTLHYDVRKRMNTDLPANKSDAIKQKWRSSEDPTNPQAGCHQYTSPDKSNVKFVSRDGHREVIYNSAGDMVTDPRDIGTYNFSPSNELWYSKESLGHLCVDIIPWVIFGNNDNDPGPILNEVIRLFERG